MTVLDLNDRRSFPLRDELPRVRVWVRPTWVDDWQLRSDLHPTQVVWSAHPEPSTASLHYHYGAVVVPGTNQTQLYTRIQSRGYYVLIEIPTDDSNDPNYWLGFAESPITTSHITATQTTPETGTQTIPCFGMERVWDYALIQGTAGDASGGLWRRFGNTPATFNSDAVGNRTATQRAIDLTRTSLAYGFAQPTDPARVPWSTRDIVQHLLAFWAPTPSRVIPNDTSDPDLEIPWRVTGVANLPNWDTPTLHPAGQSVSDVLRQLVTPGRGCGLAVGPTVTVTGDEPSVTAVTLEFQARLAVPITVPGIGSLPYATELTELRCKADPLTSVTHTADASDVVDQIIVQGPREISVCTLTVGSTQLAPNWTSTQQSQYSNGASSHPSWSTWTNHARRVANRLVRETTSLGTVYRDLRFFVAHDGRCRNAQSIFPDPSTGGNAATPHISYPELTEILDTLPLVATVDYTGDLSSLSESGVRNFRRLLGTFKRPHQADANKRIVADVVGQSDSISVAGLQTRGFTLSIDPDNSLGPGLRCNVSGDSQLQITTDAGTIADGINDTSIDLTTLEVTVAIRGDRRPLWAIPFTAPPLDVVRRRVHTFEHRSLQLTYLPAGTVLGLDDDNERITATGGIVHNPLPRLQAICELIAAHTNQPRHRVEITTSRTLGGLPIGHHLASVDTHATEPLRCPVIEVRIDLPLATSSDDARITQTIVAASNHLDVLGLLAAGGFSSS